MNAPRPNNVTQIRRVDPDSLSAWFIEFRRVASEAGDRFEAGELHQAMTSLAAVPMIHHLLVDGCEGIVHTRPSEEEDDDIVVGLYL